MLYTRIFAEEIIIQEAMRKFCLIPIFVILNSCLSLAGPMTLPEVRKAYREKTECLKGVKESDNFFFRSEYVPLWKEARSFEAEDSFSVHVPVRAPYHYYAVMTRIWPRKNETQYQIEYYLAECHHEIVVRHDNGSGETSVFNRFVLSAGGVDMASFPNDGSIDHCTSLEIFSEMDGRVTYMKPYSSEWDGSVYETGNDRGRNYRMVAEVRDRARVLLRSVAAMDTGVLGGDGCPPYEDIEVYPEYFYKMEIPYPVAGSHVDSLAVALNELDETTFYFFGESGHNVLSAPWDGQKAVMEIATDAELDSLARHGSTPVQRVVGYEGLLRRDSPLCFGTLLACLPDDEGFVYYYSDLGDLGNVADFMIFLSFKYGRRKPFDERQLQVLTNLVSTGRYPHINPMRLSSY